MDLDQVFAALAHPTRRAMLDRLMAGERSATELGAPFGLSQPTISGHLRVLREAGLVTQGRAGSRRPIRLDPRALARAEAWIGRYRRAWEESLERLEAHAKDLERREGRHDGRRGDGGDEGG